MLFFKKKEKKIYIITWYHSSYYSETTENYWVAAKDEYQAIKKFYKETKWHDIRFPSIKKVEEYKNDRNN